MGMGGNENSNFPITSQRKRTSPSVVLHQLLRELRRIVTHCTVIAHQLRSAMSLTLMISATQKTINRMAAMNWQNMSTSMGMGAGGNGNSQWEWEGNGNKTRLNLDWEWEWE